MEGRKIKNIVILILLMVNGFLLFLVVGQQVKVRQYQRSALTRASQVLERNGITLADGLPGRASADLQPLSVTRDPQAEADLAQTLLGDFSQSIDRGGGVFVYNGTRGSGQFLASGDFSITLNDCPLDGKTPADHAEAQLVSLSISAELTEERSDEDGSTLVFRQLLGNTPLYSSLITFRYDDSRLLCVSGNLLTGSTAAESAQLLDVPTVLIRFLDGILTRGDVCSAVNGMRLGYRASQSFGSGIQLTPVWLVSTNVSDYYLNALTGELEPAR